MHFSLVDRVIECSLERVVTLKQVSQAEEYLQDHFPTFPVLPGVLMLESLVQAGRVLASHRAGGTPSRLVLGRVRALKYGRFVQPGAALRVEVTLRKSLDGGVLDLEGKALLIEPGQNPTELPVAASGRFELRPIRVTPREPAPELTPA
jgi:3-hydroxymyristoyl/3-hydroxydecanoyl-(acyl carrier protein) dehydratase